MVDGVSVEAMRWWLLSAPAAVVASWCGGGGGNSCSRNDYQILENMAKYSGTLGVKASVKTHVSEYHIAYCMNSLVSTFIWLSGDL